MLLHLQAEDGHACSVNSDSSDFVQESVFSHDDSMSAVLSLQGVFQLYLPCAIVVQHPNKPLL